MRSERACYQWRFMNRLNVTPPFSSEYFFIQTIWKFFSLGKNTHFWRKHARIYLIHSEHNVGCIKNEIERNTNERENEVDNQVNVIRLWTVQDWVRQREYFNGLGRKLLNRWNMKERHDLASFYLKKKIIIVKWFIQNWIIIIYATRNESFNWRWLLASFCLGNIAICFNSYLEKERSEWSNIIKTKFVVDANN